MADDDSHNHTCAKDQEPEETPANDESTNRRKRKRKRKRKTDAAGDTTTELDSKESANADNALLRTVFVEGLPYEAEESSITEFFHPLVIVEMRLPRWQDTGRLRGYGHLVLESEADRNKALELNGKHLGSRYLSIQPAKAPREATIEPHGRNSQPSSTLLIGNLSYEAEETDLETVLAAYGRIVDGGIRIARHNHNRRSKGFAFVEYADVTSAQAAYQAAPITVLGRPCRVDYDHGQIKPSFRTSTGRRWEKTYGKRSKRE